MFIELAFFMSAQKLRSSGRYVDDEFITELKDKSNRMSVAINV